MDNHEQRIAQRAYHLWEQDGRPDGRAEEYWERARFLIGIEENSDAGMLPNPSIPTVQNPQGVAQPGVVGEPLREAVENLGEFPGLADQGEKAQAPVLEEKAASAPPAQNGRSSTRSKAQRRSAG
jgi:hypothetical protein